MSLVETLVSTAIGYSVATAANYYILPLFGHPVSWGAASWIGVIFTGISLIRGYLVRRLFNWIEAQACRRRFRQDMQKWIAGDATIYQTWTNIMAYVVKYPKEEPAIRAEWQRRFGPRNFGDYAK